MKLTHTYTGLSMLELHKKYNDLFWSKKDPWWAKEKFAKETPEKGTYEIYFDKSFNQTFSEQTKDLVLGGLEVCHPAIAIEAVLEYFKKTGEKLLPDWYARTSAVGADGNRVDVGGFDGGGLCVFDYWDDDCYGDLGLLSARNLNLESRPLEPLDFSSLELRIKKLEEWQAKVQEK